MRSPTSRKTSCAPCSMKQYVLTLAGPTDVGGCELGAPFLTDTFPFLIKVPLQEIASLSSQVKGLKSGLNRSSYQGGPSGQIKSNIAGSKRALGGSKTEQPCLNCEGRGVTTFHRHRDCFPAFQQNWVLHCRICVKKDRVSSHCRG